MQQIITPTTRDHPPPPLLPPLDFPPTVRRLLKDKVAIVTGASRGIGAATAIAFVKAGAKVVLAARDESALDNVAEKINEMEDGGGTDRVVAAPTDVTNPEAVRELVNLALERFGHLDIAFNNAGGGHTPAPLADISVDDYARVMDANAKGTILCMKYEIPAMLKNGAVGSAIVNMSSTAGLQGVNGIGSYVASKHAVIGLTRVAAMDYAWQNIRVNVVAPGPIFTERLAGVIDQQEVAFAVPMGHIGKREEVTTVVVWLSSDLASFVTGAVVPIDGEGCRAFRLRGPLLPQP